MTNKDMIEAVAALESSIAEAESKLYSKIDQRLVTPFSADWQCVHGLVRKVIEAIEARQPYMGELTDKGE